MFHGLQQTTAPGVEEDPKGNTKLYANWQYICQLSELSQKATSYCRQLKRIHETQQLWHRSSSTQKSRLTWLLQVMHWKQVLLLLSYHIHVSASKRDADLKEIVTECIGSVGSLRGAAEHRGCTAPDYLLSLCQNFLLQLLKMLMAHRKAELKILLHIYLHWF